MTRKITTLALGLISLYFMSISAWAADYLIPVGRVIGLELYNDTVTVAAFDDALPAGRTAGLQIGDEILSIDDTAVNSAEDVRRALTHSDGTVEVVVSREGQEHQLQVTPTITPAGPKLGVYLRQGITGIGTVTYYDPDTGCFGTLGHAVSDGHGNPLEMTRGNAYPATVVSVQKGKCGKPGQLKGSLQSQQLLGTLSDNTARGVFGKAPAGWQGEALPVASGSEIRTGSAVIRSTVDGGEPRDYSVEILKIYPQSRSGSRNLLLKVTDPDLLQTTGGIVQGMSGSPIIQDGKLVGAVTHVLVNDPTRGYGIFIENMLDAAG